MIFVGKPGILFKYKTHDMSFNNTFNLILTADTSVYHDEKFTELGYVIPVKIKEFLKKEKINQEFFIKNCVFYKESDRCIIKNHLLNK